LTFTGRQFDIETGLYYYRARYYNPYIGRFLQTDPIGYGDGMNWYVYCKNNPLRFLDPSGWIKVTCPTSGDSEIIWPHVYFPEGFHIPVLVRPGFVWITIPTLEAPQIGVPWTLENFFWFYKYGKGGTVDFYSIGLLEKFKTSKEIAPKVSEFENYVKDFISKTKKSFPEGVPYVYFTIQKQLEYNFARLQYIKDLFVLGGGTLNMEGRGTVYKDGSYSVQFSYTVYDPFADVLDPFNRISDSKRGWLDFDDCTPFPMIIDWAHIVTYQGAFWNVPL